MVVDGSVGFSDPQPKSLEAELNIMGGGSPVDWLDKNGPRFAKIGLKLD